MVKLENHTAYDIAPYTELNQAFRRIIAEEVSRGTYRHVSASRTSKGMAEGPVGNYQAYVHLLVRSPDLMPTGHHVFRYLFKPPLNSQC